MGNTAPKNLPEVQYHWTYRRDAALTDTAAIVSGDGSTVGLYSRDERVILIIDGKTGELVSEIRTKQKNTALNVAAIPSISYDGSRIITRDKHSVIMYDRSGTLIWEYKRKDKVVRNGMQSWIAQISQNGKLVVVKMFQELILIDADTGNIVAATIQKHQNARAIPRISDDGSIIVAADGSKLRCYHTLINPAAAAWTAQSPGEMDLRSRRWGDAALSGDGRVCAAIADDILYIFDTRTGDEIGQIQDVRHRDHENSCEAQFSQDGRTVACIRHNNGISVHTGAGYATTVFEYFHDGMYRPVAPLLTRDGGVLAAQVGNSILVWDLNNLSGIRAARVQCVGDIPGGPTVHSRYAHHDRDTHHKRMFTASNDGSLCVAVAKARELWAFNLQSRLGQGGMIASQKVPVAMGGGGGGAGGDGRELFQQAYAEPAE